MTQQQPIHNPIEESLLLYLAAPRKRKPSEVAICKAMADLFPKPAVNQDVPAMTKLAIASAIDHGTVERDGAKLSLTNAGEARCATLFDLKLPTKKNWALLKRHLLVRALTRHGSVSIPAQGIGGAAGLASAVLNHQEALLPRAFPTPIQVADALAWKELGGDPAVKPSWPATRRLLLSRRLRAPTGMKEDALLQNLAAATLETHIATLAALESAVLNRWVRTQPGPIAKNATDTTAPVALASDGGLDDFVHHLKAAYAAEETVKFGAQKAFIASVFDTICNTAGIDDWPHFREQLLRAHKAGHIRLSRADLVPALDRDLVQRSEIRYQNATFHFMELP